MKTIDELSLELRTHTLSDFWGLIPQIVSAAREEGITKGIDLLEDTEVFARGKTEGHHDGFHEGYRAGVLAERAKMRALMSTVATSQGPEVDDADRHFEVLRQLSIALQSASVLSPAPKEKP
jgi:flagellar biosynthesis/type III secretory pathway protein FliH